MNSMATFRPQSEWCPKTRNWDLRYSGYKPGETVEVTGMAPFTVCECGLRFTQIEPLRGLASVVCQSRLYPYVGGPVMGLDNSTAGAFVRQNQKQESWTYFEKSNDQQSKEEKLYQVSIENLTSGTVENHLSKTQEEAQQLLEIKVAALRSSLTQKNFFTASLLNTKTGVFLGSVTDAPPPVVLVNASPASS